MKRGLRGLLFLLLVNTAAHAQRLVILKVDGLNEDLLEDKIEERDPATGKSQLPWLSRIFFEGGTVYKNFYTRGISLSAPSWSMLDTGHSTVIRGNVEYDRYTGEVYDYLNFFPLYIAYSFQRQADMPGVGVLDRAGIPLVIDHFPQRQVSQSFQLFQRGVRVTTLEDVLKRRFSGKTIFSMLEGATPSYDSLLETQTQEELQTAVAQPEILYLDLFIGKVDHQGHATNDPAALLRVLREVDRQAGQIWTAIRKSPLADQTVFVMVSDHGMNNSPGVVSQTFSLTDVLNSPAGGAHHVVTNREQLSDFKLRGLNPLTHRVITGSTSSFYLPGEADHYPTAWLDLDGNERAALHLRNADLNKIHILLQQMARTETTPEVRTAAARCLRETIDKNRSQWATTVSALNEELAALKVLIDERKPIVAKQPKRWTKEQFANGERKEASRVRSEFDSWQSEFSNYTSYVAHLSRLLALEPDGRSPFKGKINDLVPEMSLGDNNTVEQVRHYLVGPAAGGLQLGADGRVDEERSFRYVDYLKLFAAQRARNNPQTELARKPVDFSAIRLGVDGYLLYGDEDNQLEIRTDSAGRISAKPAHGKWRAGLPLALFEDADLRIPGGAPKSAWLSEWHSEKEWLEAIHKTRYSNGLIGIVEELAPVGPRVPGKAGLSETMVRYEKRRRELVQADVHLFAADHWNFNVRFPNPGGNHGSFLRISTHSVWMMAGAGIAAKHVEEPLDSLSFAPAILELAGRSKSAEHH